MADFPAEPIPDISAFFQPEEAALELLNGQFVSFVVTGEADTVPPVIGNFSPSLLSEVAKNQAVEFDVTDDSSQFRRIIVVCNFAETGIEEVVHDGDEFRGPYKGKSSRSAIPTGFRYTVARGAGGWVDDPDFRCFAIDLAGNEAP